MTSISDLPPPVLVRVLQHVPQQERLGSCALVSHNWHQASVAATARLQRHFKDYTAWQKLPRLQESRRFQVMDGSYYKYESLMCWLRRHAQQMISLDLKLERCNHTLPQWMANLQELILVGANLVPSVPPWHAVEVTGNVHQPSLLDDCTALTRLCCDSCELPRSFSVTALRGLKHLRLKGCDNESTLHGSALTNLTHLTHLALIRCPWVDDDRLQHLNCLTALCELKLEDLYKVTPAGLIGLEHLTRLTMLNLQECRLYFSTSNAPWLSKLTGLQWLRLKYCEGVDPALLVNMTQLRHLELCSTPLIGGQAAAAVLLQLLPRLQHLTQLELSSMSLVASDPSAYSIITSCSSGLQKLDLSAIHIPPGAWQHAFPETGHMLPKLRVLDASWIYEVAGDGERRQTQMGAADLRGIVHCCPQLEELNIPKSFQPGVPLWPLLQLQHLTHLELSHVEDAGLQVLARLPLLRILTMWESDSITDIGLMQLTALRQLERLDVDMFWTNTFKMARFEALKSGRCTTLFINLAPPGAPPDVWAQILARCAGLSHCWQVLLQQPSHEHPLILAVLQEQVKQIEAVIAASGEDKESKSWFMHELVSPVLERIEELAKQLQTEKPLHQLQE